jgi:hypothetical protein
VTAPAPARGTSDPAPCPACGAPLGGRAGCQAAFDALCARAWETPARGAVHNLVVDAYCLQHPDDYCASAKSYAAHLTGLCCGVEAAGDPRRYWAIARWLDGHRDLVRPEPPAARGALTVAVVQGVDDPAAYGPAVRAWADAVWRAYAAQHATARAWLAAAGAAARVP